MNGPVLAVLIALAAVGAESAGISPLYGASPVYNQKSSLQSRRRPFQSSLNPSLPYGAPHEEYLKRPYVDYELKPYEDPYHLPGGVYHPPRYGLAPLGSNAGLLGRILGDYSKLPYGDYPKPPYSSHPKHPHGGYPFFPTGVYPPQPYSGFPTPLTNNAFPLSRSGKYPKPLNRDDIPAPFYPTKYPNKPKKNYIKPIAESLSKRNTTTTARPYSFSYDLVDVRGNDFGAAEESDGREVQGRYSVLLPDGRLQTVSYSVEGDSGFVADVTYEGEAKFVDENGEEEGRSTVRRGR